MIEAEAHRHELRARFSHVFVDEYQDTDPGQVALLRALVGDGGNLTVVGDPHQSIYGFRGAEVRGILEFPTAFPRRDGRRADVVALRTTRRFGPRVLLASQRVARRLSLTGIHRTRTRAARSSSRSPRRTTSATAGSRCCTFDTERAEAEHLADLLRRAHLEDGVAWSDMAVLVRSGRASIPALRRSLIGAGVPVEVASDDTPLVAEPALQPLVEALRAVVNLDNDDPEHPDFLDPDRAHGLLVSPLGGPRRHRRPRACPGCCGCGRRSGRPPRARRPRPSPRAAARGPGRPRACWRAPTARVAARVGALARLLAGARRPARRRRDRRGGALGAVGRHLLAGPAARLRRVRRPGCPAGAPRPRRRLRALRDRRPHRGAARPHLGRQTSSSTLAAQQIPADSLAERGVRGDAVRLLTAHRSKGLEWRLVVVAHVQEDGWPDLRRRGTLLQADRIGADGLQPPLSLRESLMEERRLFYVACTRARQRLVVTAVASQDDDGEQPSRFLAELGVHERHLQGRPVRPLSMAGLVAELRRTVADPAQPDGLRTAAAHRLARLAGERVGERPLVPQADPATWWGTRAATRSDVPLRPADVPVTLSRQRADLAADLPRPLVPRAGGRRHDGVHRLPGLRPRRARHRRAGGQRRARATTPPRSTS